MLEAQEKVSNTSALLRITMLVVAVIWLLYGITVGVLLGYAAVNPQTCFYLFGQDTCSDTLDWMFLLAAIGAVFTALITIPLMIVAVVANQVARRRVRRMMREKSADPPEFI